MSQNTEPTVSVIMANHNGAAHIATAVRSVLRQTLRSLELIVSDDGSTDESLRTALAAAAGDQRLVVVRSETRAGPGAARNRALDVARGRWVAIVDNDDFIHPQRLERLIGDAERDGADIACDDLLTFDEDGSRRPHAHLRGAFAKRPYWIDAAEYVGCNLVLEDGPALGYLKPVFRRNALRYDETLTIAEDSDLILRMLAGGARMRIYPDLGYFYRKHAASISHRLTLSAIDAMLAATDRIDTGGDRRLRAALGEQRRALRNARAFTELVDALKAKNAREALRIARSRPMALYLLKEPIKARLAPQRRAPGRARALRRVTLLTRQRIIGHTNGSSAYVLAIAEALTRAGLEVDLLGASPKIFGRWAMMRLKPETDVFTSYLIQGSMRFGNLVLARDPKIWLASAAAAAERGLRKLGVNVTWSSPAEYAQGAKATRADMLFVARHTAPSTRAILCDYAFLNPLAPYALRPNAPVFTIMHDLMSQRVADSAERNAVVLSRDEEFRLLGLADMVVAIQEEEAASVRAAGLKVLVAPHAVSAVHAPQAGADDSLLFVGSNTAPNIVGLEWFFREIWPLLRSHRPQAQLSVAGSVARGLETAPEGVRLLGVVDDLAPLYRNAGVVISPLFTGSGLKIKLVEALAAGKAIVGTSVTLQGVEAIAGGAIARADEPAAFAAALAHLLGDPEKRRTLGRAALDCARAHFSAEACFGELVASVRGGGIAPLRNELPT
jgi:succinoglycan biosynthesis protein ExoO